MTGRTKTELELRRVDATWADAVEEMQFAQWARGRSREEFSEIFARNVAGANTSWYCLTREREAVAAAVVYAERFGLPQGAWGIGSVVTREDCRGQGYCSAMMERLIEHARAQAVTGICGHSDIDPSFYARFGFQLFPGSEKCMYRALADQFELGSKPPEYF